MRWAICGNHGTDPIIECGAAAGEISLSRKRYDLANCTPSFWSKRTQSLKTGSEARALGEVSHWEQSRPLKLDQNLAAIGHRGGAIQHEAESR